MSETTPNQQRRVRLQAMRARANLLRTGPQNDSLKADIDLAREELDEASDILNQPSADGRPTGLALIDQHFRKADYHMNVVGIAQIQVQLDRLATRQPPELVGRRSPYRIEH